MQKIISLFYELVESKKPKSIFTSKDICDYMNGKFGKWGFTQHQILSYIHRRQLRYHVYTRGSATGNYYIYVRRKDKEIKKQIQNMKVYGR